MIRSFIQKLLFILLISLWVNPVIAKECVLTQKVCAEGAGERVIDGHKIYKDCWKYEKLFQCSGYSANNCEALREDGCVQVGSKCKEYRICFVSCLLQL